MLVTVLMSVYNSEQYLENAVESILDQTFRDFEFIIIDDGSTDNSTSIIEKYASIDSRIVFIKNDTNIGLASSLNKGIKLAKGKYIARQDADDLSALNRLELQLNYATENQRIDIIGSNCYIIDIAGNVVYENKNYSNIKNFFGYLLNRKSIFPHGSAFMKTNKLIESGLYDSRFYYSQDGEFWLRLIRDGAQIHTLNKPLYYYRSGPRAYNKKNNGQLLYNKVKQMIYAENDKDEVINEELENIRKYLTGADPEPCPYYMADYWKSLANAAYLNNSKKSVPYKYIFKAFAEKSSISNYTRYIMLCFLYIFPSGVIKHIFKLS